MPGARGSKSDAPKPVGRDTELFWVKLGTRGRNAPAWFPGGIESCFPTIDIKMSVPPPRWGSGCVGCRIPRGSHAAPLALEPELDQQPPFPRFHHNHGDACAAMDLFKPVFLYSCISISRSLHLHWLLALGHQVQILH